MGFLGGSTIFYGFSKHIPWFPSIFYVCSVELFA